MKKIISVLAVALIIVAFATPSFASEELAVDAANGEVAVEIAEDEKESNEKTAKAWAAAVTIGAVASIGAVGMTIAISKGSESIARQPEAASNIRTNTLLGLVFIETAIIYALIVTILIVFVL